MKSCLTRHDYEEAISVQSACNLSGVVFAFARIMEKICRDGPDTEQKNTHVICRLFAEQIMHLTKKREYAEAYEECRNKSLDITLQGIIKDVHP